MRTGGIRVGEKSTAVSRPQLTDYPERTVGQVVVTEMGGTNLMFRWVGVAVSTHGIKKADDD